MNSAPTSAHICRMARASSRTSLPGPPLRRNCIAIAPPDNAAWATSTVERPLVWSGSTITYTPSSPGGRCPSYVGLQPVCDATQHLVRPFEPFRRQRVFAVGGDAVQQLNGSKRGVLRSHTQGPRVRSPARQVTEGLPVPFLPTRRRPASPRGVTGDPS